MTQTSTARKPPATETIDFLTLEREAIIEAAETTLGRVHPHHYEDAGAPEVRRRLEALFDRLLESLATHDLGPVFIHVHQIAEERFNSGYDLSEVQAAFNALEAAIWARVFATLRPDQFAQTLGLISTILGAAKDGLARGYVSLATHGHAPSLDLRALFAGTDSA
jgi:hypothetical protein